VLTGAANDDLRSGRWGIGKWRHPWDPIRSARSIDLGGSGAWGATGVPGRRAKGRPIPGSQSTVVARICKRQPGAFRRDEKTKKESGVFPRYSEQIGDKLKWRPPRLYLDLIRMLGQSRGPKRLVFRHSWILNDIFQNNSG
jgi:hypothetical protein